MYKQNYFKGLWKILLPILIISLSGFWFNREETIIVYAKESKVVATPTITPTPALEFTTQAQAYVYKAFGDDYERAFEIINCESKWNEKAFNDNTIWGGVGQDRGLWQINNIFHPISDECAYDYKCSTDYAFRMYMNDNQSFIRWTCGNYEN